MTSDFVWYEAATSLEKDRMQTSTAFVPSAPSAPPARPELTLVPPLPAPGLRGKARKDQRKHEAAERAKAAEAKATTKATPVPTAPTSRASANHKPSQIIERDGVRYVVCPGQYGNCKLLTPVSEARVATIGAAKRRLDLERYDEISEDNLASISFCASCADKILKIGHSSIAETLALRDKRIAEYKADRAKAALVAREYRRKAAVKPSSVREKAKRAASGGAFGEPGKAKPADYLNKKAQKAKASKDQQEKAKGHNSEPPKYGGWGRSKKSSRKNKKR